ncbi:MurR/RpiR family transcriptional regulator [Neorhizobium sp. SHOUNA12A]|uniref:MurR/RpiR family transcriptional regulator n=2 Tax=unclassified Neorhizobium TaxID=2629175 RepID=UPI001FF5C213|nr:MurR/RpiR family transcriptional regulator [Neorhizobium sp. SHOUNA12A]MCJ9744981.1 MurR/RpiR family transcriptional regulator [Neorhizobium sp. SHOUNA12A]
MNSQRSVLPMIRAHMPQLPMALRRIGKYIVENPDLIVKQTADQVATLSGSGKASVVRFCRLIGFEGFQDFKFALAGELAARPVRAPDASALASRQISETLRGTLSAALQDNVSLLDYNNVETLAVRLVDARRVDIYGAGVSGILATLLATRLLRLGIMAFAFSDPKIGAELAHGLDATSVAIGLSETGITSETVQALKRARSAGVFTAAITARPDSPIVASAETVLLAAAAESPLTGGALTVAFTQLFVIEVLVSAVAIEIGRREARRPRGKR